jgi:ABC-type bacteriocin/lantibiotic exporter with double-glycine peptidase domain
LGFIKDILIPAYRIVPAECQRNAVGIIFLMVLQALLDFVNLGLYIPLLAMIAKPEIVTSFNRVLPEELQLSFKWKIFLFASVILIFSVLKHFIVVQITQAKTKFAYGVAQLISLRVLNEQLSMSYQDFVKVDFGKEMDRMAHLPVAFATNILLALATLISEGLIALMIIVSVAIYNYQLLISLLVILIPVSYSYILGRKRIKRISNDLKANHPDLLKSSLAPLEGWLEIKTAQAESFFKTRFYNIQKKLMTVFAEENTIQTNVVRLTELFAAVIICFIIFWALIFETNYQQIIMLLAVYVGASFRLLPSINRILNALVQVKSHHFMIDELRVKDIDRVKIDSQNSILISLKNQIVLTDISFSYEGRETLFRNLKFDIKRGEKVAIVGKSGCGKSTFLLILIGMLKANGKIFFDGSEISGHDLNSYQRLFSYIQQSPYIFNGTIEQNIAFGLGSDEINNTRMWRAIEQASLTEFLKQLPDQEQTMIHEKGIALSGGQRQRIALARALYSDREILVFDEVTNQLDQETEQSIIKSLREIASQNKTFIMVTHHPSLLSLFDRVLKLENGKLTPVT